MLEVNERVFSSRFGGKYISILLSDFIQNQIVKLLGDNDIKIINGMRDENFPDELANYLSNLEKDLLLIINEVIKSMFSEYFYDCKGVAFSVWQIDDGKVSANFRVKSKVKGANMHLDELSDILEKEF